jgi:hypothetical protein
VPEAVKGDEPRILQRKVKRTENKVEKGKGNCVAKSVVATLSASDVD